MLPTQKQARKVVWNRVDRDTGRKTIDIVFPPEIRKSAHTTEMYIDLLCGSTWQLCGSDSYDSLVGGDPIGVVFSEWSLTNPAAWDFVRPILAENGGWALFIYTPRGRNHGYRLYQMAKANPRWFAQVLTVDDTNVISPEAIEEDRESGMAEELIEQEYWCSFDAATVGAYYGHQIAQARKEGRIANVPHDPNGLVHTWWDIGIGDQTAIWFFQQAGPWLHFIDAHEDSGKGLDHYVRVLQEKQRERGFSYGRHIAPHDIRVREWGTGLTRAEQARNLGVDFEVAPMLSVDDGINAVRAMLPRCVFDESRCERAIDALSLYRKEWDEERQIFRDKPLHDWTSHYADAFRIGCVTVKDKYIAPEPVFPEGLPVTEQIKRHIRRASDHTRI